MDREYDLEDIGSFLRRRKKIFFISFFLLFLLGFIIAIALPPIYKSESIIRIEDQQIPEDFVQPTMTDYAEERIEKISQLVLSRPKLLDIIKQFNLYPEIKAEKSPTELIKKMRKDIGLETIVADLKSKKVGRNITVTVAFNLSYEGKDPVKVQKVADTLSKLYLEEDLKRRRILVSGTTEFLDTELNRIKTQIEEQEKKISNFKKRHLTNLPSDSASNLQTISRLERELDNREMRKRLLEEKKLVLESQLANVEPLTPILVDGKDLALSPNERLKGLRLELTKMQSIYSDKHPDIKKLKREIAKLEKEVNDSDYSVEKVKRLKQLEVQLANATSELGPNHPDVKAIKREIDILNNEIKNSITETTKIKISEEKPDNPTYINLKTQIETIEVELKRIEDDKRDLLAEIDEYRNKMASIPTVEKELNALNRDYQNLKNKYAEISNKLMNAQLVREMESEKKGGQFSIVSAAYLPIEPSKPNRLMIVILSFLLAIGISSALAIFQEKMDNTLRTSEQIKQLTGVPVLTSISYIITSGERTSKYIKKLGWAFIILVCIGSVFYGIDRYVIKLDQLWIVILERMKMFA